MPDPTPEVTPEGRTIVKDLSQAMASEQPASPAPPKREPPKQAPSDGAEVYRDIGKQVAEERAFLDTIFKALDDMRIADPDTRRLKLIVQALVNRMRESFPEVPPAAKPADTKPANT